MVKATRHIGDATALETVNHARQLDAQAALVGGNARLPKVVEAPGPDRAFVVNGKTVVEARKDTNNGSLGQVDGARHERLGLVPSPQAGPAAQLAAVAAAPGVDGAVVGKGQDVVDARDELLDVPETGDLDGRRLEELLGPRPVAALDVCLEESIGPVASLLTRFSQDSSAHTSRSTYEKRPPAIHETSGG